MININGKTFSGNDVVINNGKIIIDGKEINNEDQKTININIEGNLDSLEVGSCNKLSIKGDVGTVESGSADLAINGNVGGSVRTGSGDVVCGKVSGSVKTGSGDIIGN